MGDRTTVRFEIGGKLNIGQIGHLVELLEEDDFSFEHEDYTDGAELSVEAIIEHAKTHDTLQFVAHEVNYGNCDELEAFLRGASLAYRKEWDAGGCYGAGGEIVSLEGDSDSYALDGDSGDPLLGVTTILETPFGQLYERCQRLSAPIPEFEITLDPEVVAEFQPETEEA